MNQTFQQLVRLTEAVIPFLTKSQCLDNRSSQFGGLILPGKGYSEPMGAVSAADVLVSLYYCPDSRYYRDGELMQRILLFLQYLDRVQHEDGTLDLLETNFHDATVNGFANQIIGYTYRLVKANVHDETDQVLMGQIEEFMRRSAVGMLHGGFHTPNHRWVMASALAILGNNLAQPELHEEAMRYIQEGIDCDDEGNYTERSTGIYDVVSNNSLIIMADELNMPEMLEPVARNLRKVYTYIEPDGTLLTMNSRRQDNHYVVYPYNHFWACQYMAQKSGESLFAAMGSYIFSLLTSKQFDLSDPADLVFKRVGQLNLLTKALLFPWLTDLDCSSALPVPNYEHWYRNAGIVRKRSDHISMSILENNNQFFVFQKGRNKVSVKLTASFFARGRFSASRIEKTDTGYRLVYDVEHGYVRPLKKKPGSSIWEELDHASREKTQIQRFCLTADIAITEQTALLSFTAKGTAHVPVKIEFIFEPDGIFETDAVKIEGKAGSAVILKTGSAWYTRDFNTINISDGIGAHDYTKQMRGSDPADDHRFTVYMTAFTPFMHQIKLS